MTTQAEPIPVSVSRVVDKVAKRVGYRWAGICTHCRRPVIVPLSDATLAVLVWRHRESRFTDCPVPKA